MTYAKNARQLPPKEVAARELFDVARFSAIHDDCASACRIADVGAPHGPSLLQALEERNVGALGVISEMGAVLPEAQCDRISAGDKDNGYGRGRRLRRQRCGGAAGHFGFALPNTHL